MESREVNEGDYFHKQERNPEEAAAEEKSSKNNGQNLHQNNHNHTEVAVFAIEIKYVLGHSDSAVNKADRRQSD